MNARLRTMDFDAVAASAPLDALASAVRDGSGDHWEAKMPSHARAIHFKAPPAPLSEPPCNLIDLRGHVYDRLTVIRYHGHTGAGRALWLVRCVCGDYEIRRHQSLSKSEGKPCCCHACGRLDLIRARTSRPSTSKTREESAALLDRMAVSR